MLWMGRAETEEEDGKEDSKRVPGGQLSTFAGPSNKTINTNLMGWIFR